jgi:hypothetical protein
VGLARLLAFGGHAALDFAAPLIELAFGFLRTRDVIPEAHFEVGHLFEQEPRVALVEQALVSDRLLGRRAREHFMEARPEIVTRVGTNDYLNG